MPHKSVQALCSVLALCAGRSALAAEKQICVSVTVRGPSEEKAPPTPKPKPSLDDEDPGVKPPPKAAPQQVDYNLPLGQNPVSYLKRLMEYFVTHEKGFAAVESGCQDHIDVELYPLREGWTVFARYSGNGREERVDYLFTDELSQFAERAVLALLYDKPVSTTILRDTVLRADSKRAVQRIRGTNHFLMALGTQFRIGSVPTLENGGVQNKLRFFSPITLSLGYRGKFENWGLETVGGVAVGTSKTGLSQPGSDGHVDYGGNVFFALHFLRYLSPRGLTSFFFGAGGSFEVMWFYQINPGGNGRNTLSTGGFDIDLVGGVEFMRASKVQFLLQLAVLVPAYPIESGEGLQPIKTYLPGATVSLGMLF